MRILLVAPYSLSDAGGLVTVVNQLRESLERKGHKASVLVAGDSDDVVSLADPVRRETYGLYLRRMRAKNAALKSIVGFWIYLPISLFNLYRFLVREKIEVVHLHFPTPSALYFSVLRLFSSWKLVVTVHGSDVYSLGKRRWTYRVLLGLALSKADLVTAVSEDLLRALRKAYTRLDGTRCVTIYNGNPLTDSHLVTGCPKPSLGVPESYILAVGSLIRRKGYDVLLKAIRITRDGGHDFNLVIVGDGPGAANLSALAAELGVNDRVSFAGEVSHHEIIEFYSGAKFFVHAAREEAFGLVLLEAMGCRKPVIATRVNGIPEFVRDGDTGLLVAPEDPEGLATAMIRLETDEALRASLATRGYEFAAREHTWERMTEKYLEAYGTVVGLVS